MKITARNFEITETLREYISKRLGHLDRYSEHIINSEIIFQEERGQYLGEMIVKVKGRTIKAETRSNDILKLVDELKDIVIRELKKYEEKLKDHRR
ncbi:MAG: ribosome-associated translation inhibitor RaiA [candidate division WOR-3 bacterium]|nr:ribosome-associated translation inhibitor RaiA [candidate division WOR-3 bacterium]MCX7947677.1 ribosome-associated translation inhibitor RaiA [candidate division WOR-3 bacterium]MDW8150554.1 ribosome-associated translation inhibitor RaiA [candidate division WOR-3 bacterium]